MSGSSDYQRHKGTGRIRQQGDEAMLLIGWGEAGSQSWLVRLFSSFCLSSSVKAAGTLQVSQAQIPLKIVFNIQLLKRYVKKQSNNNEPLTLSYNRQTLGVVGKTVQSKTKRGRITVLLKKKYVSDFYIDLPIMHNASLLLLQKYFHLHFYWGSM